MGDINLTYDMPSTTSIDDLSWTPKRIVADERGAVLHMLKEDQFTFPVGEIYFSRINPGVIKGWKLHSEMKQRFCVPAGSVKFVFVDQRTSSRTRGKVHEIIINQENYGVITVPAGLWYSFRGESEMPSLIVNAASIARRAGEAESIQLDEFSFYTWA